MSELDASGDVVVKNAIGDWSHQKFNKKLDWQGIGFKIVDQSRQVAGRNSSDFRLVIEAMELALNPDNDVDTFAVMSSDQGFIPLYLRLRQLGKKVIVAGNGSLKNHRIRECTDRIIATGTTHAKTRSTILNARRNAKPEGRKRNADKKPRAKVAKTPMNKMQRDHTRNLIRRSLGKLRSARRRSTPLNMYRMMKRQDPKFSVRNLGYATTIDLLTSFPEIITVVSADSANPWVRFGRSNEHAQHRYRMKR